MNLNLKAFFKDIWIWLKNNPFRAYHIVDESKENPPVGFRIFGTISGGSTNAFFNGVSQDERKINIDPFCVPYRRGSIRTDLDLEFAMDKTILHRIRKPLEAKIAARTGDLVQ